MRDKLFHFFEAIGHDYPSLVYAELVLRRFEDDKDDTYFSGVVLREELLQNYDNVIQGLICENVTVAGLKAFRQGHMDGDPAVEQWLFSPLSERRRSENAPQPLTPRYVPHYYDLDEETRQHAGGLSLEDWLAKAQRETVARAWRVYESLVTSNFDEVTHIAAVPIVAPGGTDSNPSVGALFLGIEQRNLDTNDADGSAWRIIGEIARYTYVFALRTFARQAVERDARQGKKLAAETAASQERARAIESAMAEEKKLRDEMFEARTQIDVILRKVSSSVSVGMGKIIHAWRLGLEELFAVPRRQVRRPQCKAVLSSHQEHEDWRALMAAGLLDFAAAPPSSEELELYEYWERWSNLSKKLPLVAVLERLGLTGEIKVDEQGYLAEHFKNHMKGWKDALHKPNHENDLNIAMLELALGGNLGATVTEKRRHIRLTDTRMRERILTGLHLLMEDLLLENEKKGQPPVEAPVELTSRYGQNDMTIAICISRFRSGCATDLIGAEGVRNLFERVQDYETLPSRSKYTATWSLINSLGLDPGDRAQIDKDGDRLQSNSKSGRPIAAAYWDEGLWLEYWNAS